MSILTNSLDHQARVFAIRSLLLSSDFPAALCQGDEERDTRSAYFYHSIPNIQQQSNKSSFEIIDIDCTIANYFADRIFEQFSEITLVAYWRDEEKVTIWTVMVELDRKLRREIYKVQEKAFFRFPEYMFDFYVVSSVSAIPDSFTVIKNPAA